MTIKLHTTRCNGFEASATVSHLSLQVGFDPQLFYKHLGGALTLTDVQIHSTDKKNKWKKHKSEEKMNVR